MRAFRFTGTGGRAQNIERPCQSYRRFERTSHASKELLIIDFTHPATGAVQAMTFRVTRETGLNGFHALPEMQAKDIVTIDYEEQPDGISKAIYVAKFRISGPPTGLENFKGF